MKRLILASAILGLAGAFNGANAVIVGAPGSAAQTTALGIWSQNTNGTAVDPLNQALPNARVPANLVSASPNGAASGPINFNLAGTSPSTIGAFLATSPTFNTMGGCGSACLAANISGNLGAFNHASLFEFQFTVTSTGTLTVNHDDGVSLFADPAPGTGCTSASCPADLFPVANSGPTFTSSSVAMLTPGTYDLFYTSANGLPEVLTADFVVSGVVPEPASLTLLGSALIGLGWLSRRRRKAGRVRP